MTMSDPETRTKTDIMPRLGEQLDYAVSSFGYSSVYIWITAFMTIFLTDYAGVPAAAVSLLLLVVRFFDAVNDPLIGSIADRTHSRFGRFKPWVGIGGTVMCILIVMMFATQKSWPLHLKIIWVWVVYILITVASTCQQMPYNALCGVITSSAEGRIKLSNTRMVCSSLGTNFTNLIAAALILTFSGTHRTVSTARGYLGAVIFSVAIGLPFMLWTAFRSRERVLPPPVQRREGGRVPVRTMIKCLTGNKYALLCVVGQFVAGLHAYGRMTIMTYYFTYYEGDFKLYSMTGMIGMFTGIVGSGVIAPWIYKMFHHKGKAVGFSFAAAGILVAPMYWFSAKGVWFWVFYAVSTAVGTAASGLRYACDGDNTDYAEYKYGVRVDGFLSSFVSLSLKAGGAVGPAVMLAVINSLAYAVNVHQNQAVMNALNISMSFLPAVLLLIIGVTFWFGYDMDEKKHKEIVRVIEERHREQESAIDQKGDR